MKKTLLAVSIAALAAGTANAGVKIYESETGFLESYGRIQLELQNADGENTIQNQGSRLGFKGETQINDDLTAFANVEFRFNPGVRNRIGRDNGFDLDVRDSWLGVKGGWGSVKAGNFDSLVDTYVTSQGDLFENVGWATLDSGSNNARGTALAYETNDLNGLKLAVALKHYASDESDYAGTNLQAVDGDEQFNIQIAAKYQLNNELSFGLAFDQNNEDGRPSWAVNGEADPIIAASVNYATDAYHVGLIFENSDDFMITSLTGGLGYAYGDIYASVAFLDDGNETGVDFALGANYKLASNFRVYGEVAVGNDDASFITDGDGFGGVNKGDGISVVTLGARYSW